MQTASVNSVPEYISILPVEVCLYKGASWLYAGHIQRLHRAFKRYVRVDSPEAAEVVNPNQQGRSLTHGPHIQLPDERRKQEKLSDHGNR